MQLTIRDAGPADIPSITAIYRHAVIHGTASFELEPPGEAEMERRFRAITEPGYPYLVAAAGDGSLAGYAYANAYRARPAYRWSVESSVYIDPERQGAGVGRALMRDLIDRSQALGFRQMIAVIGGSSHKASIRLHESLGFYLAGTLRDSGYKHGQWLDSVLMQRSLGEGADTPPDPESYPGTLYRATKSSA